ncbi:hypothetical protein CEXT_622391 [Caerostris extrusa]|uniref:Uncharacterized protein n=1 Tax=Caerostris extrusa TaxID=172846 RepID=A0AAV4SBF4_CAEEX|nr:hypothetical protein CEXT_622391 [Caerostris extrusa]
MSPFLPCNPSIGECVFLPQRSPLDDNPPHPSFEPPFRESPPSFPICDHRYSDKSCLDRYLRRCHLVKVNSAIVPVTHRVTFFIEIRSHLLQTPRIAILSFAGFVVVDVNTAPRSLIRVVFLFVLKSNGMLFE